ncbi:MAG: nucleotide exchange factor GrpE [Eubacteriaceae bacterium]
MEKEEKIDQEIKPEYEEAVKEAAAEEDKETKKESKAKKDDKKDNKENEKIIKLENEKKEIYESYLRLRADFDNYKKRIEKEKAEIYTRSLEDILKKMLPILDNFERAVEAKSEDADKIIEGVKMVYEQMTGLLKSEGLEMIDAMDKNFDPEYHHAVMTEQNEEKEDNAVLAVLQNGYALKDRVIRPAMVKVNKL